MTGLKADLEVPMGVLDLDEPDLIEFDEVRTAAQVIQNPLATISTPGNFEHSQPELKTQGDNPRGLSPEQISAHYGNLRNRMYLTFVGLISLLVIVVVVVNLRWEKGARLVVEDSYSDWATNQQFDHLSARGFNDSSAIGLQLNISHSLGMIDLLDTTNQSAYSLAHKMMFEVIRIYNSSVVNVTGVNVLQGKIVNGVSQAPTGEWYATMRNSTSCIAVYPANVSPEGAYLPIVDYTPQPMTSLGCADGSSAINQYQSVSGAQLVGGGMGFLSTPYYNAFGVLTIAVITSNRSIISFSAEAQTNDMYFWVETKASSWTEMYMTLGPFEDTEVAITDRNGCVYSTFPVNYLVDACVPGWSSFNLTRMAICNYYADPLTTDNFPTRFPDSQLKSIIGNAVGYDRGVELHMTGFRFVSSKDPSWQISSPLIDSPQSALGNQGNNLVSVFTTSYHRCYGELDEMLLDFMIMFMIGGLCMVLLLGVPLLYKFGRTACPTLCCLGTQSAEVEIKLLKNGKILLRKGSSCVSVALLALLAAWIISDRKIDQYNESWVTQRADANSKSTVLFAETFLLQPLYAANLVHAAARLGVLDLSICNLVSTADGHTCSNSVNLPATALALSYASLTASKFDEFWDLGFATSEGNYAVTRKSNGAAMSLVTTPNTSYSGGTNQHLCKFETNMESLWTNSWDLQSKVDNGQLFGLYDPVYDEFYSESVSTYLSGASTIPPMGRYNSRVVVQNSTGMLAFCVNRVEADSQIPAGVVVSEVRTSSLAQILAKEASNLAGAYIVDSAGNLVATTYPDVPLFSQVGGIIYPISAFAASEDDMPNVATSAAAIVAAKGSFSQARGSSQRHYPLYYNVVGFSALEALGQERWSLIQLFELSTFEKQALDSNAEVYVNIAFGILLVVIVVGKFFEDIDDDIKAAVIANEQQNSALTENSRAKLQKSLRSVFAEQEDGVVFRKLSLSTPAQRITKILTAHIHIFTEFLGGIDISSSREHVVEQVARYLLVGPRSPSVLVFSMMTITKQTVLLRMHAIRSSVYYESVRQPALLFFLALQGWNHQTSGSTFVTCIIFEGAISALCVFHSFSSFFIKRYEKWLMWELKNRDHESQPLTKKDAWSALCRPKHYGVSLGTLVAAVSMAILAVTYFVKLAGYYHAFGYARGVAFLVSDRHIRTAGVVMCRTMQNSRAVFFLLVFFIIFCTLEALIMLRYSWSAESFSDSPIANFNNFQDASLVMYIFIALGENYADIFEVVYGLNRGYGLFFLPIALVGIVFLLALVAATFESVYVVQNNKRASELYIEKMTGLAAAFGLWSQFRLKISQSQLEVGNFDEVVVLSQCDGRIPKTGLDSCRNKEDVLSLWDREVFSQQSNPSLNLTDFKGLVQLISRADTVENWLSPQESEGVAMFAFQLLDTDHSNTISFAEFEDVWGVYNTIALLHCNEILRWQVQLEQQKRQLAHVTAESPGSQEASDMLIACAKNVDQFKAFLAPLDRFNGVSAKVLNQISLTLCIGNAFAVAQYSSNKSHSNELRTDWFVRSCTVLHFIDAMFRLSGLVHQPILTTDYRQKLNGTKNFLERVWLATTHQYLPRETMNNKISLVLCCLSVTAMLVDVLRHYALDAEWNDNVAIGLKMIMILPILRTFLLLQALNQLVYTFVTAMGPVSVYGKLLLVVMYFYTLVGVDAFGTDCDTWFGDSITSFYTLFQMFIGEGWYGVMYECMEQTHKMSLVFFVSYIFIVTIAFASLFISLVFQIYGDVEAQRTRGEMFVYLRDALGMISDANMPTIMRLILEADLGSIFSLRPILLPAQTDRSRRTKHSRIDLEDVVIPSEIGFKSFTD